MAFTTTALLLAAGLGAAGGYYGYEVVNEDQMNAAKQEAPAPAPAPVATKQRKTYTQAVRRPVARTTSYQPRYQQPAMVPQQVRMGTNYTYPHPTKVCYRMDPRTYRYYVSYCD